MRSDYYVGNNGQPHQKRKLTISFFTFNTITRINEATHQILQTLE